MMTPERLKEISELHINEFSTYLAALNDLLEYTYDAKKRIIELEAENVGLKKKMTPE